MKYMVNGRSVNIPDKEIESLMKSLDISKDEAVETWLFDNEMADNEEADEMTEKAKAVRRYEKSDTPRKRALKERKVDTEKQMLLSGMRTFCESAGAIGISTKNEAEFSFTFGETAYTVKLIKHRPPKK